MAYTEKLLAKLQVGAGAADDLTATGVHSYTVVAMSQMKVSRIMATVTTAVVSSGAVVVAFKKYINYGSATGAVTLGSISIPAGSGLSDTIYKDITPVVVAPGEQVVFEVTTAAAGGGAAGGAVYDFEANYDPEFAANQSNMIASA